MTVSDQIAEFLAEKGCLHAFGIIGAGNLAIFDAIHRLGRTQIICVHHEQAAAQAAIAYFRASSKIAPVLVTTGAGSANAITGVLSAWMDSIPLYVIAGQEASRNDALRAYGVQGFDVLHSVSKMTKGRVSVRQHSVVEWKDLWNTMLEGRMGPVWIEVPTDVQRSNV